MMPQDSPTTATLDGITARLDEYLDPVLSTRRTSSGPARGLLPLTEEERDFALHWTDVIRRSNSEMAFQFVSHAPKAIRLMGLEGTRRWLLHAMDVYDKEGLYPGCTALDALEAYAAEFRLSHITVSLDQIRPVLETFITGLAGRTLKLEAGNSIYTDTNTLYLPAQINRFNDRALNYCLYKVMSVHLWAQTWFGTFRRQSPDAPHLVQILAKFQDNGRALRLFNLLETARLNACIGRELPGLAREMFGLHAPAPVHDATWRHYLDLLEDENATVSDTLAATEKLYPLQMPWPEALVYQGGFDLEAARDGIEQRLELEKDELQSALAELLRQTLGEGDEAAAAENAEVDLRHDEESGADPELAVDGEPVATSADLENLLRSLLQDLEDIPEDWLVPAGDGDYDADEQGQQPEPADRAVTGGDTYTYDEWDYRRQTYRKNWCTLRETTTQPVYDDFYERTLKRYAPLVGDIRRYFEALRGDDRILKAEPTGDNVDLDALITAYADMQTGVEMSDRVYTRKQKVERDLAVVFMVDVSGSTKGWINEAERESLILLCEALEILGDQYAIYGFSGMTRNRCEVYRIKSFARRYDDEIRARISGLRPQDYTRMGVTIRHLAGILGQVEARTRILITLSDGKPDDYDGYRGEYGIEDTRQALLEARNTGIHPFCITIDTEAGEYLPHMYGPASFVVVDEVRKLPLKVADIYRRLTT